MVLSTTPMIQAASVFMLGAAGTAQSGLPSLNLEQNLTWAERETVKKALESAGGVKKDAAELMGISQRAMSYYVQKHKLE